MTTETNNEAMDSIEGIGASALIAKYCEVYAEVRRLRGIVKDLAYLCRRKMDNKDRGKHAVRIAAEVGVTFSPLRDAEQESGAK